MVDIKTIDDADKAFTAAMENDLNVSEALAVVNKFVTLCNKSKLSAAAAEKALKLFNRFEDVLGCFGGEPSNVNEVPPPEIQELLNKRNEAKKQKNWTLADQLREKLKSEGWTVRDIGSDTELERITW